MSSKSKKKKKIQDEDAVPQEILNRREVYDWIQCLITALIICVMIFVFFIRVIDVVGTSMLPTLQHGNKMLVSGFLYKPKYGDVVVFKADSYDPDKALVKRVIAVGGDDINIDFDKGIVYVNGEPIEEPYINELTKTKLDFIGPKEVPEGCVFVMGDNRNASTDSRDSRIGMVDSRLILGKVYFVLFPLDDFKLVE